MCKTFLLLLILFFTSPAWSQTPSVVSHYPESAYVVGRLLPFSIEAFGKVKILGVNLENGKACASQVDLFHQNTFHIYCRDAARVQVSVHVVDEFGEINILSLGELSIAQQRAPSSAEGNSSDFFGDQ